MAQRLHGSLSLLLVLLAAIAVAQDGSAPGLRIETATLPSLVPGQPYQAQLRASGDVPPVHWRLIDGHLPRSLSLDPSGRIAGTPLEPGAYRITVEVQDSSRTPQRATRAFTLTLPRALLVRWIAQPSLQTGGIFGSLRVTNGTGRDCTLTVIVVAVNEIHKAFTLGYQHFDLAPESESPDISFGFTLPQGTYGTRADAVCEVPATGDIFRAAAQSDAPIPVP